MKKCPDRYHTAYVILLVKPLRCDMPTHFSETCNVSYRIIFSLILDAVWGALFAQQIFVFENK